MNHKLVWGGAHKGYHLSSASAPQHLTSIPLRYIRLSRFRIAYMYHLYPILFALRDLEWDLSGRLNIECHELNSAETELVSPVSLKQLMNQWKPIESYLRRLYVIKSQDFRELQQFSRDHAIDYEYPAFDPHNRIGMMLVWRQRFFWNGRAVRLSPQKFSVVDGFRLIQNLRWTMGCFSVNDSQTALCVLHLKQGTLFGGNGEDVDDRGLTGALGTIQKAKTELAHNHEVLVVPSVTLPVIADLRMDQTIQANHSTVMVSEFRLDLQDVVLSSKIILNEFGLSINPQKVREMAYDTQPVGHDLSQSNLLIWIENLALPNLPIVILKYER